MEAALKSLFFALIVLVFVGFSTEADAFNCNMQCSQGLGNTKKWSEDNLSSAGLCLQNCRGKMNEIKKFMTALLANQALDSEDSEGLAESFLGSSWDLNNELTKEEQELLPSMMGTVKGPLWSSILNLSIKREVDRELKDSKYKHRRKYEDRF